MPLPARAGRTSVSGPGQKRAASASAVAFSSTSALGRDKVGDVDDQRIEPRPALGGEDGGDRGRVGRVGGEAIDGLGRQRDDPARLQHRHGAGDAGRVGRDDRHRPAAAVPPREQGNGDKPDDEADDDAERPLAIMDADRRSGEERDGQEDATGLHGGVLRGKARRAQGVRQDGKRGAACGGPRPGAVGGFAPSWWLG